VGIPKFIALCRLLFQPGSLSGDAALMTGRVYGAWHLKRRLFPFCCGDWVEALRATCYTGRRQDGTHKRCGQRRPTGSNLQRKSVAGRLKGKTGHGRRRCAA